MGQIRFQTEQRFPSVVAAWVICDAGSQVLPKKVLSQMRFKFHQNTMKTARRYVRQSYRASYDSFLSYLERHDHGLELSVRQLKQIAEWLDRGQADNDIRSAIYSQQNYLRKSTDLRKLRLLKSLHRKLFPSLPSEMEEYVFSPSKAALNNFGYVLRWLEQLYPTPLPEGTYTQCMTSYLPAINRLTDEFDASRTESRVREWAAIMESDEFGFPGERQCPKELRTWLRRLGGYQQFSGEERRVPKSVDRFLNHQVKLSNELAYLAEKLATEGLGDSAKARLEYLQTKLANVAEAGFNLPALVEKTKLACLRAGLDALRNLLRDELAHYWQQVVNEPARGWDYSQLLDFLVWSRELPGVERNLFREIMSAWHEHGKAYKAQLGFNQRWLDKASRTGLKVAFWLNPDLSFFKIEQANFSIEVSQDPLETFLMGEHFRTCLSFTGCNSDSILANAAHANKQVILVRNEQQQVVSRMLVAISESFEMIRFSCYVHNQEDIESFDTKMTKAVFLFCEGWAKEIGIQLGKSGLPANLGSHFWYDDGVREFELSTNVS